MTSLVAPHAAPRPALRPAPRRAPAPAGPALDVAVVGVPGPGRDRTCRTLAGCPQVRGPMVVSSTHAVPDRRLDLVVLRTDTPAQDVRGLLRGTTPARHVLVLSPATGADVVDALRAGATSYLVEGQFTCSELISAVVSTSAGQSHLSPPALTAVIRRLRGPEPLGAATEVLQVLSRREREVMTLVAAGHSNASIARQLFLAEKTVRNHLNSVYRKLAVRSRADAVITWLGRTPPAAGRTRV